MADAASDWEGFRAWIRPSTSSPSRKTFSGAAGDTTSLPKLYLIVSSTCNPPTNPTHATQCSSKTISLQRFFHPICSGPHAATQVTFHGSTSTNSEWAPHVTAHPTSSNQAPGDRDKLLHLSI
jgi:hypothetical protein